MTEAELAPSRAWGLWAGDRSFSPVDGALIIGGYDPARIDGDFTTYPLGNWSLQQPCPLQVTISSVLYNRPNGTSDLLTSEDMIACVEPFQDRLTFTPAVTEKLANVTSYNSSYNGLTYPIAQAPDGNLTIVLDNNYTTVIPNSELFTLQRGSDQLGHYAITNSSIVATGIMYNAQSDPTTVRPTLGGLYLTFNYLVVDYESGQFQLAPAVQGTQPTSFSPIQKICSQTPTGKKTPRNSSSKTGAIVGGTVGGVLALVIIGVLAFLYFRRQHRRRRHRQQESIPPSEPTPIAAAASERTAATPSILSPALSEKEAPQWPSELPLVRTTPFFPSFFSF